MAINISLPEFLAPFRQSPEELVHLRAITPRNAPVHLIRDYPKQEKPPISMIRVASYKNLTDDREYLKEYRALNKKRGIYFVVNPGGDSDLAIKRFVATFSESDPPEGADVSEFLAAQIAIEPPLPPSAALMTYKSIHRHWLIEGVCSREEYLLLQQGQIAYYDCSDASIMNESRVMRLPGFNHVRVDFVNDCLLYKPIDLLSFNTERKYTVEELQKAFPVGPKGLLKVFEKLSQQKYKDTGIEPSDELRKEVEAIRKHPRSTNSKAATDNKVATNSPHDKVTTLKEVLQRELDGARLKRITIKQADYAGSGIEPDDAKLIEETIERICLQLANARQGTKDNTLLQCGNILYGLVKGELTTEERITRLLLDSVKLAGEGDPQFDLAHAGQTARNAYNYATATTLEDLRSRRCEHSVLGGRQAEPPEEPPERWDSSQNEPKSKAGKDAPPPLAVSWAEFDTEQFPQGERIAFAAERGEIALVSALPNAGKTTLALIISLCLAIGRRFLPVVTEGKARRVLYVDGETRRARLQRDLRTMTKDFSREEAMIVGKNLNIICEAELKGESLALTRTDHLLQLSAEALRVKPDFIVIDTLSSLCPVFNENDNAEQTRKVWRPLQKLARDCDAAILVLHHVGKRSEDSQTPERVYRGRGASASGGAARAVWLLIPDAVTPGLSTLSCVKAKGETPADVRLQLDPATRWIRTIEALAPAPTPLQIVVAAVTEEVTTAQVVAELKDRLKERAVKDYLAEAVEQGLIRKVKYGVYAPKSAESAESAKDQNAQSAQSAQPKKGKSAQSARLIGGAHSAHSDKANEQHDLSKSAESAEVIGNALSALSGKPNENGKLSKSAESASPIEQCTPCTLPELQNIGNAAEDAQLLDSDDIPALPVKNAAGNAGNAARDPISALKERATRNLARRRRFRL